MVTPTNPIPINGAVKLTLADNISYDEAKLIETCTITTSAGFSGKEGYCFKDKNFGDKTFGAAKEGKGARALWFVNVFKDQEWYTSQF